MDESKRKRKFHYKNRIPSDPQARRFGEWSQANIGFYNSFRDWLKETGYSDSALSIYSVAARYAIGYLDKPYWVIDLDNDLERVKKRLQEQGFAPGTIQSYQSGLDKFDEFIRLRCHRPPKPKVVNWAYHTGSLPQWLTKDIKDFIAFIQQRWPIQRRHEYILSSLSHLTRPLRWMVSQFQLNDIGDITPEVWFAYVDHRLSNGIKTTTINSEFCLLRHLLFHLEDRGNPVCSRTLLVDYLDEGRSVPKDVPRKQIQLVRDAIQQEAESPNGLMRRMGIMDRAWFYLMLHSGLRTCEVRAMRLGDINWDGRRLRVEQSKGLNDRIVYLSQVTIDAIQNYVKVRGPAEALPDHVFIYRHKPLCKTYCYHRLRTYSKRCGVRISPHQLRHSCATLLLNAGAPILTVKMLLGHKYVDTTLGYARLYDGTVASDYFQAMALIEKRMNLPEDQATPPPIHGELIALVDSLCTGTLNHTQQETVRLLRAGILTLVEKESLDSARVEV